METAEVSKNRSSMMNKGADGWWHGATATLTLAAVANLPKLLTARDRHGEGWLGAKHVVMILERCKSYAEDVEAMPKMEQRKGVEVDVLWRGGRWWKG